MKDSETKQKAAKKKQGTDSLTFGKRLRGIMDERGLTVRAVAEISNVSGSVVQSWISKANPHDLEAVSRLAKALNVGFKTLLIGEPEEVSDSPEVLFDHEHAFEGYCKIKVEKLVPKKRSS